MVKKLEIDDLYFQKNQNAVYYPNMALSHLEFCKRLYKPDYDYENI